MKSVNSSSRDHFSNPPKLNHALRQRQDVVECHSQNRHHTNNGKIELRGSGGGKGRRNEITLFSVNENTRGKLQDENRIDFPEISSLKNDPKKVLSDHSKTYSATKEYQHQKFMHQKLPIGTLSGQEVDGKNGTLHYCYNGNMSAT